MIQLPKIINIKGRRFIVKLRIFVFVLLILGVTLPHFQQRFAPLAQALTQTEIDELNKKLQETQQKLNEVKSQKDKVAGQLSSEQKNQTKLIGDAGYLDKVIQQNELLVESLRLEIVKLDLEVEILTKEKEQLEERLIEIESEVEHLNNDLTVSMNLLYKMSLNSPTVLEENTNFEDSIVSQEKQKSLIKIIQSNLDEVKRLQQEVAAKKDEIATKEAEVSDLKSQKLAQTESLEQNQKGLEWQKKNKLSLLEESKKKASELNEQKSSIETQIQQYEANLNALKNALYLAPPSGTPVPAGQYIGAVGRTGLSCDWGKPDKLPENYMNYCSYLGSNWYYYPPSHYPQKGAHLHFELRLDAKSKNVDPSKYLNTFVKMPVDTMNITQGFHSGHNGIDIAPGYGKPVYAVKAGRIVYSCDSFDPDPAYGAVIYHDDGSITQYWHLIRPAGVKC